MEKQELKELLKSIRENDYKVPQGVNPYELSLLMMDYIGDIDSELRDKLIYSILYIWVDRRILDSSEVYELLKVALDEDHILRGLGYVNDSVFNRAFSVLVVAISIMRHREEKFLSKSEVEKAFEIVLESYNNDKDVRGYVEDKGWAHGAAHGADAIDEFARCEEIGYEGLKKILDAIYKKVNINHYGYIHFEDERMITPVKSILEREIVPIDEIIEWINSFKNIKKIGAYPEDLVVEFNVNVFLKSLYFRLIDKPEYEKIRNAIIEVIKEISSFTNY